MRQRSNRKNKKLSFKQLNIFSDVSFTSFIEESFFIIVELKPKERKGRNPLIIVSKIT